MEERHAQIFADIAEKKQIDDDLDKRMTAALNEYGEEFKDTIK
jgi:F0F1-type ATP synthase alpha subunit